MITALEVGLAGKYRVLTEHRANIPARVALEALHAIFGLTAVVVAYLVVQLIHCAGAVLPSVLDFVHISFVTEITAIVSELAYVTPFIVGFWGGRQWIRRSALSNFLRCSNHGGLATLYNPDRFRLSDAPESLIFTEQKGDALNLFKPRGATVAVLEPLMDGTSAAALVVCNVHMNLGASELPHWST